MTDRTFEKWWQSTYGDHAVVPSGTRAKDFAGGVWEAALAYVREEFAQVTGLGTESSIEEILGHYVGTVNRAVKWRDELAHLREPMSCGHPAACLYERRQSVLSNLPDGLESFDVYKGCLVCDALKKATDDFDVLRRAYEDRRRDPQTAETCQHVPPHPIGCLVLKEPDGPVGSIHVFAEDEESICLVCEAVKEAVNAALLEALNKAKGSFTVEEAIGKIYRLREEERK